MSVLEVLTAQGRVQSDGFQRPFDALSRSFFGNRRWQSPSCFLDTPAFQYATCWHGVLRFAKLDFDLRDRVVEADLGVVGVSQIADAIRAAERDGTFHAVE